MSDLTAIELAVGPYVFDAVGAGPAGGEPVLLLHGFPEGAWCWRFVQPRLADAGYRVVAPDQRGYSPRARPTDPADYGLAHLVGDVLAFAEELGWDTFHLVGHDWGGAIAWHVAGRHPERIRTLTVVSTPHPNAFSAAKKAGPDASGEDQAAKSGYIATFRSPEAEDLFLAEDGAMFRMVLEGSGLDADSTEHYAGRLTDREALTGALNWYRGADPADPQGLGPILAPTLYVWSTEDIALGQMAAELTGPEVTGPYRFEVLDGVSHWVPEMAPERLTPLILEHLAGPHGG